MIVHVQQSEIYCNDEDHTAKCMVKYMHKVLTWKCSDLVDAKLQIFYGR